MRLLLLTLLANIIALAVPEKALAQKPVHKQASKTNAKPTFVKLLTVKQIADLYALENLPPVDEYLSAHGWRFAASEPGDSTDAVVYVHKLPSGVTDGRLAFHLCNMPGSGYCIYPKYHDGGGNKQHIFQVVYAANKANYEVLQNDVRSALEPTSSKLGNNSMTTTYRKDNFRIIFILDRDEDATSPYLINLGDVMP